MKTISLIEPRLLKGFKDFSPKEQKLRQQYFSLIQSVFELYGFLPLATPALEYKEILLNKYGDEEKLVYSFMDPGGREVALRYDLTVPLARFVALNLPDLTLPFKRYQVAPVWRAENPQAGRRREFYQCDIDIVGSASVNADAEIIACVSKALEAVGVKNFKIHYSSREVFGVFFNEPQFNISNITEIIRAIDKLAKLGKDGVLDILRAEKFSVDQMMQVEKFIELAESENAMEQLGAFSNTGNDLVVSLRALLQATQALGVRKEALIFNPSIARGLDYYTGMVFEVMLTDVNALGAVASGGRYDNLISQYSKQNLPCVGGSIGVDRLFEYLNGLNTLEAKAPAKVLLLNMSQAMSLEYLRIAEDLRAKNIACEVYFEPVKMDKQFKYALSLGIPYVLIYGEAEQQQGVCKLKDLTTRVETVMSFKEAAAKLAD